jgi:hypothetical protein
MTKIQEFIQYLESKVGNMYVWGAQGQRLDTMADPEAWIRAKEIKQGISYVNRALAFYQKVKGKVPLEAYDCSGLIVHYICDIMRYIPGDKNAQGLYSMCYNKANGVDDLEIGDLVFIYNSNKQSMGHVGVYVGNGMTIEAYGRDKGVVKLPLKDGKWTHSGRLQCLQETAQAAPAAPRVTKCTGQGVNVRTGRGTQYNSLGKADKNAIMLALPAVKGWCEVAVMVDGHLKAGYMSDTYVED